MNDIQTPVTLTPSTSPSEPLPPLLDIHLSSSVGLTNEAWCSVLKELGKATADNLGYNSSYPGRLSCTLQLKTATSVPATDPTPSAPGGPAAPLTFPKAKAAKAGSKRSKKR